MAVMKDDQLMTILSNSHQEKLKYCQHRIPILKKPFLPLLKRFVSFEFIYIYFDMSTFDAYN